MNIEIAITSGEILNFLEEKKVPLSISEVRSRIDEPIELINMSIGWLLRKNYVRVIRGNEKYLSLVPEGETNGVILRKNELAATN